MINLLPRQQKRELGLEITQRKIFLILVFVSVFFLCLALSLFLVRLYIASRIDSLQELILEKNRELQSAQVQNFKAIITESNQNLSKIKSLWANQTLLVPFLERLYTLTPSLLYFTDLSFAKIVREVEKPGTEKKEKQLLGAVRVAGVAKTRDILFSFKQSLESGKSFDKIYFSPVSWIEPIDGEFSLIFEYLP